MTTLLYSDLHCAWEAILAQAKACEDAGLTAEALRWEASERAYHRVLRTLEAARVRPAAQPLTPAALPDFSVGLTLLQTDIEASLADLDALEVGVSITLPPQEPPDECPC